MPFSSSDDDDVLSCREVYEEMLRILADRKLVRNYHRRIRMSDGAFLVETDLFPFAALRAYSAHNLGDDDDDDDDGGDRFFDARRGGPQGDYREGMRDKIDNAVDCLSRFPLSKRAVVTIPNRPGASHESDADAKCLREVHLYLDEDDEKDNENENDDDDDDGGRRRRRRRTTLNATVWMRAQAAEIFPKNVHFVGSLMERVASRLSDDDDGPRSVVTVGELFYLATTLVSMRED